MIGLRKLAVFLIIVLVPGTASAAQVGRWQSGIVQGYTKYWTVNNDGAHFTIWCKSQRNKPVSLISIDIEGQPAPPSKRVEIAIGRSFVKLDADRNGYLPTNCPTCADNFVYLWNQIRSATRLAVTFADDRHAGFSLDGARDVLPGTACSPASGG